MKKLMKVWMVMLFIGFSSHIFAEELGLKMANLKLNSNTAYAKKEGSTSGGAAHKGMVVLQFDFNLGSHGTFVRRDFGNTGFVRPGFVPGFTFNADFGVHDYVSVGPYIGFGGRSGYFQMATGARGVFHWWQLLDDKVAKDLKSDKIDFYLPVHLGVIFDRVKYYPGYDKWHAAFNGGAGLGFRYYFVKQFAVNLEWGWMEMSYAKIGFTFQLK